MENDVGKVANVEDVKRVYSYLVIYGRLGAHPIQIAKALSLSEDAVMQALESLQGEEKVRVRSSNMEWKFKYVVRNHVARQ